MRRLILVLFISVMTLFCRAANKVSVASGDWSIPSTWSPAGVPAASDDVTISAGHIVQINVNASCKSLQVISTAQCKLAASRMLTLNGSLNIDGLFDMNGGDISQTLSSAVFSIGNTGTFIWNPGNNTVGGATLFTHSVESFAPTSTLNIVKWYSFTTVPLGAVVTGNFGNVKINTRIGNTLFEWNQDNQFETHEIKGTLTIDDGWVVLDKSGKISNTKIGNIVLSSMNSVLDLHSGTHPSSFKVTVDSIANIGGELNGIFNGDGNIQLNVTRGFMNMGNVELIYNAGVANLGKGNAQLTVGGKLKQTHGDFRGIFNLSTVKAGKVDMTISDLELYGGIFMCFYGCNESGVQNTLTVQKNLVIDFANASDKFRINGLTTLMGQYSKARSLLTVNGVTQLSGDAAAEFTSSGSVGAEENNFQGNVIINGLTNNFNYGSHAVKLNVNGDLVVNGGNTCFSKMQGNSQYNFSKKMMISSGTLMLKSHSGMVDAKLQGDYIQSGGVLLMHANIITATTDTISFSVFGKFHHLNGVLNFDDNIQGSNNSTLKIFGDEFWSSGSSLITRAGTGTGAYFGNLAFSRQGIVQYRRSTSSVIDQIKQMIVQGCTIQMAEGNFQVSSHGTPATDYLTIASGANLLLNNAQIVSNSKYANSGVSVLPQGVLTISRKEGLYNSSQTAAINSMGNMNYYLDANSVVEYAGESQLVTGSDVSSVGHQYGNLKISASTYAGSNVIIRNKLELNHGSIDLNSHKITLTNGNPLALSVMGGYLNCRNVNESIEWQNMKKGNIYEIPFSSDGMAICPLQINPNSNGTAIVFSYASSPMTKRMPVGVNHLVADDKDITDKSLIERWYGIQSDFNADVRFSFSSGELPAAVTMDDELTLMQYQDKWTEAGKPVKQAKDVLQYVVTKGIAAKGVFALAKSSDVKMTEDTNNPEATENSFNIISTYPNPFEKYLKVNYHTPGFGVIEISLVNAEGKICYQDQQQAVEGENRFDLPESLQLAPGIYILQMKGFKKAVYRKIIHR